MKLINEKIRLLFALPAMAAFVISCNPETDALGAQLHAPAQVASQSYDLVAYNINNSDTVRADQRELAAVQLGAYSETLFGQQKAEYASQLRPATFAPDMGVNPVVDSAVLVLSPNYDVASAVSTVSDFTYPEGNVAAKKTVTRYNLNTYGKDRSMPLTLDVREVTDYMGGVDEPAYSNKNLGTGSTILGSAQVKGVATAATINKTADNAVLFAQAATVRIPLSKDFFQQKVVAKRAAPELADPVTFSRYFKGLKISVRENDGYLFNFDPTTAQVVLYYKSDVTANNVTTRTPATFVLNMGNGNTKVALISYNRNDAGVTTALAGSNPQTGDAKLYLQGMGGPSAGIRIPNNVLQDLRTKYMADKIAILGAKIRIYTDALSNNSLPKPGSFVFLKQGATNFLPEVTSFTTVSGFKFITQYNGDTGMPYYEFDITKTLGDAVVGAASLEPFILHMGQWRLASTGALMGYQYDTRAHSAFRMVMTGTAPNDPKRITLNITYNK